MSQDCPPFDKKLKSDEKVLVLNELAQQFEEVNKALDNCFDLALKQPPSH